MGRGTEGGRETSVLPRPDGAVTRRPAPPPGPPEGRESVQWGVRWGAEPPAFGVCDRARVGRLCLFVSVSTARLLFLTDSQKPLLCQGYQTFPLSYVFQLLSYPFVFPVNSFQGHIRFHFRAPNLSIISFAVFTFGGMVSPKKMHIFF